MNPLLNTAKLHRRNLHQIPELSFQEFKTTRYIREHLDALSIPYFTPLETATLVFFKGQSTEDDTIAFRGDIDALPIKEETGLAYASTHEGVMHACGHDGHTSILLTFAQWCKEQQDQGLLEKNILLIFQPSEETNAGADAVIQAFPFKDYHVKQIFGIHLGPDLPEHTLATRSGFFMASATEYQVSVKGLSAHVAQKEKGQSALGAVNHIVSQFSQVQHYFLNGLHQNILHIGSMSAGEAPNTVASNGLIKGTIRTYNPDDLDMITEKMQRIVNQVDSLFKTASTFTLFKGYPAVHNDPELIPTVKESAKAAGLKVQELDEPYLFGEDFSFYSKIAQTNFSFLGVRNEEKGYRHGLHTSRFNFDEDCLLDGIHYFQSLAKSLGAVR